MLPPEPTTHALETIKLSAIRELSPLLQRCRYELAEFEYEAYPTVGHPTELGMRYLLDAHPVGVITAPNSTSGERVLVYGLRSFQIAACCLDHSTEIRVRNLDGLPREEIEDLGLADIVVSFFLYADRELPLGLVAPVLRRMTESDQLNTLERVIYGCSSFASFAQFLGRSRDTLYEREHRLKRYSESKVPRLTALGFQRLLQLHPIGVSQAPNRQIIFGWRSARIATGTRFFSNCVERRPIGRNNQDEIDTRQIADLLLGNVLYTLRATTLASAAPLFNRLKADELLEKAGRLVANAESINGIADLLRISGESISRRARKSGPISNREHTSTIWSRIDHMSDMQTG